MTTLRIGSSGPDVTTLQKLLNADASIKPKIVEDGNFGNKTKVAVKQYQTAHRLDSDGIVGTLTWDSLLGTNTKNNRPIDYKQNDPRWGEKVYTSTGNKSQKMKNSGCGPTAMADVVATFFDNTITPYDLAMLAVKNGFRTRDSGTAWSFFPFIFKKYPFTKFVPTTDHEEMLEGLAHGALVVSSMGPGYWTQHGHFICVWKYDGKYIYANDPASPDRKRQLFSDFKKQRKKYFIFYPPVGWDEPDEEIPPVIVEPPVVEPPVKVPYSGPMGIYDISKWQGNVNFAKVKESNKAGLFIVRAGFGQNTTDSRFKEYVTEIKKQEIPFGAYWFSYATSIVGAEKEAENFYNIASPHNPLFYVMDAEDSRIDGSYINAFANKLRAISGGKKIGLYVANHLFETYKKEGMDTSLWDFIWIPKYTTTPPTHRPCDIWQTGGSRVPGFSGSIDTNVIPSFGRYDMDYFLEG